MATRATQKTRADAADADTMPKRRRFDVWECHAMRKAGILHPEERLESIDGDIMVLNPFESAFTAISEDRPDMGWVRMDIRLECANPISDFVGVWGMPAPVQRGRVLRDGRRGHTRRRRASRADRRRDSGYGARPARYTLIE